MKSVLTVAVLSLIGLTQIIASPIQAQVVINEFLPDPADENDTTEWIELFNPSESQVSLVNFTLDDQEGGSKPFSLSGVIEAKGLVVVEKRESKIGLNNDGDEVRLFNGTNLVDSVAYQTVPVDQSYARISDGNGPWQTCSQPTRGSVNAVVATNNIPVSPTSPTETKPVTYSGIAFSEIYACPEPNEPEWVELFNASNQVVNLDGCEIRDRNNNQFSLSGEIQSQSYSSFSWDRSFINNDGDEIILDCHSVTLDTTSIGKCNSQTSFIKHNGQWLATTEMTKDQPNRLQVVTTPIPTSPIVPTQTVTYKKTENTETKVLGSQSAITNRPISTAAAVITPPILGIGEATRTAAIATSNQTENGASNETPVIPGTLLLVLGGACLTIGAGYGMYQRLNYRNNKGSCENYAK